MKLSASEQEQITALLTRIHQEIMAIEEEHNLLAGEGDFRARIEYFHDAVRAFFAQDQAALADGGRLSVEHLAYDVSCLRYLQAKPLAPFKPHGKTLSASTGVIDVAQSLTVAAKRPDRTLRERLSELYRHYAVLFAALLKPVADKDFMARTDSVNQDVAEMNTVAQELQKFLKNKGSLEALMAAVSHVEDPELHHALMTFLHAGKHKKHSDIEKLLAHLKGEKQRCDKQAAAIDKAHMQYAMSQLAIYEESKDMLKSLAGKGMNLVGKFVEASISQARREMGR